MNQLSIAIIGHTNTGKTSLIRNLTRERNFGVVKDEPSTTIDVSSFSLSSPNFSFHYIDTPGIEDAIGILEILEARFPVTNKVDEPKRLLAFTQHSEMYPIFEQEIKVIKQIFATEMSIYVIDTRLPYLPKFDNELTLILQAHKPILPIFNFLSQGSYLNEWKAHLKAHGIHSFLEYDTVVLPQKRRLYEQIAIMFPDYYNVIQEFIHLEEQNQQEIFEESMELIANFYLNILTYRTTNKLEKNIQKTVSKLQKMIINIEKTTIQSLLNLYHFNDEDIKYLSLAVNQTHYDEDFFTSDNLINFSMHFGKGATIGAGLFMGVDALAGFTTLGAATATGAIIGGVTNTVKHYSQRIWNSFNKIETYCINNEALISLTSRMLAFIGLLNGRSHAEIEPILFSENPTHALLLNQLIEKTHHFRAYPNYCTDINRTPSKSRDKAIKNIKAFFLENFATLQFSQKPK